MRGNGKDFYTIHDNGDGTADVYLNCTVFSQAGENGAKDYDVRVYVVKGVEMIETLENDIRERYCNWVSISEEIWL